MASGLTFDPDEGDQVSGEEWCIDITCPCLYLSGLSGIYLYYTVWTKNSVIKPLWVLWHMTAKAQEGERTHPKSLREIKTCSNPEWWGDCSASIHVIPNEG